MKVPKIPRKDNDLSAGMFGDSVATISEDDSPNVTVYTIEEIEKKFNCKLETKHGYLPQTLLPNSDMIAESVVLLSKSFGHIHEMSSAIILAPREQLDAEEKKVIKYLINEADKAPICDEEDEGVEILLFFPNACVTFVSPHNILSRYEYMGLTSKKGYSFDLVSDKDKFFKMLNSNPEDSFLAKIVDTDVVKRRLKK
jgi:hypothetical protein